MSDGRRTLRSLFAAWTMNYRYRKLFRYVTVFRLGRAHTWECIRTHTDAYISKSSQIHTWIHAKIAEHIDTNTFTHIRWHPGKLFSFWSFSESPAARQIHTLLEIYPGFGFCCYCCKILTRDKNENTHKHTQLHTHAQAVVDSHLSTSIDTHTHTLSL